MQNQTKIEKLIEKLPLQRKIDLDLSRINRLNKDLKINLEKLQSKCITLTGTNGKFSTAITIRSIFEAAGYKVDLFTSPHVQNYTERFVFESKEISEENLIELLSEVSRVNGRKPITVFEFLTSAFFFYCDKKSNSSIIIAENGLFNRADSVTSIGNHLMKIINSISLDHIDWLPEGKKTLNQIIVEKTSNVNCSNIVVSEQNDKNTLEKIYQNLKNNSAKKKILFSKDYDYEINQEGFLYKEKNFTIQIPKPNFPGNHMVSNTAVAIAAVRNLKKYNIRDEHIINGVKSVKNTKGRLEILYKNLLKKIAPDSTIYLDVAHNPDAGLKISEFLSTINKGKGINLIIGMMNNKLHFDFISCFKGTKVDEIVAIDIPGNKNCIKKEELKKIIEKVGIKTKTEPSIKDALKYLAPRSSTILVCGSIYLIGALKNLG